MNYRDNVIKQNTLKDIVDLFGLAFCSYLITHTVSSWSAFARQYMNKPNVTSDIGKIDMFIKMLGNSEWYEK